mgnify:FL=1
MSDFKDELVTEYNDLAEKADKLSDRLCSIIDYSEDEELQKAQLHILNSYLDILFIRCVNLGISDRLNIK